MINSQVVWYIIFFAVGIWIGIFITILFNYTFRGRIKKDVRKARESLRVLYKKYQGELFNVTTKIDKYLEALEE